MRSCQLLLFNLPVCRAVMPNHGLAFSHVGTFSERSRAVIHELFHLYAACLNPKRLGMRTPFSGRLAATPS
jgi:hypothetical protein